MASAMSWQQRVQEADRYQSSIGIGIDKSFTESCIRKKQFANKQDADAFLKDGIARKGWKARSGSEGLVSYCCDKCSQWHIKNNRPNWISQLPIGEARTNMSVSVPGLHRGVSGLHHGKHPRSRIGNSVKASQRARWKAACDNRLSSARRTPQKPPKQWSREALELEADRLLANAGFTEMLSELDGKPVFDESISTKPYCYEVTKPDLSEDEEKEILIVGLEHAFDVNDFN
jgi:hypothetical protein